MTRTLRFVVALSVSALAGRDVAAQWNVERFGSARNPGYLTFGLDPALLASVGYGRVVPLFGRAWQLGAEVGVVGFAFDGRDFRARMHARTSLLRWRSLRLVGSAAFIARGTENPIHGAFTFDADFTGAVGVYRRGWFMAGELGLDRAIITKINAGGGGTVHYGVAAGAAIGAAEVLVRARRLQAEDLDAGVGLGFRF